MTGKVSQIDLVLVCEQGTLVGLCTQDCKSLCIAVTIGVTMVNIQTDKHRHTSFDQLIKPPIILVGGLRFYRDSFLSFFR